MPKKPDLIAVNGTDFLKIVGQINAAFSKAKSKNDVFQELAVKCKELLNLSDCAIYEWIEEDQLLIRKASYSAIEKEFKNHLHTITNLQGLTGKALKTKSTVIVDDTTKSNDYIKIHEGYKSEICIPVFINEKVYAVISSENENIGYYSSPYPEVFELLASIAAHTIFRIEDAEKTIQSVTILTEKQEKQQNDLEAVLETVSDQFAQLKHSQVKQDILLREVHHRVNNNLQIITSILNLHLMDEEGDKQQALFEIAARVEAMAMIHTNVYKTVEMNKVDLEGYLEDVIQILNGRATRHIVYDFNTHVKTLNLNSLVPLGMLIVELALNSFRHAFPDSVKTPALTLNIEHLVNENKYKMTFCDNGIGMENLYPIMDSVHVGATLIHAYIEQLNGAMEVKNENGLNYTVIFEDI
jgi:two-component sensor histidine kinase